MSIKKKKRLFVLIDSMMMDYVKTYGAKKFDRFSDSIREDLARLYKKHEIILLIKQNLKIINSWLRRESLIQFFDKIVNFNLFMN